MQSGIELGPNQNNEILKVQFTQSTLINKKMTLQNREETKKQPQIDETDLFMTQDHTLSNTIGSNTHPKNNHIQQSNHFQSYQEINRNNPAYQPLENTCRSIVNLNKYGKVEVKEVVNLAKSYLLSDNQKDLRQLITDKNNYVMGKSISSLTQFAKKRDYKSLKYLKQFNKEQLTPYQQLMIRQTNETRVESSSKKKGNLRLTKLSEQLSKQEFRKCNLEDTNYSFMQVGSMGNQYKEPFQIQK